MERMPLATLPADVEDFLRSRGAAQVNLYRCLANAPELCHAWLGFMWALRDDCVTPRPLRELMILRTAVLHGSAYEWHHHEAMALAAGLSPEKVDAVRSWSDAVEFDDSERAVLAMTDAICEGVVTDEVWNEVATRFGPRELVELALTASAYVMVPRLLDALAVPLEVL